MAGQRKARRRIGQQLLGHAQQAVAEAMIDQEQRADLA
jgi:hypothetical protein